MITQEDVKKALALIKKSVANHDYFYRKLESSEWVKPLADAGQFDDPPGIEREGTSLRFPMWHESEYLARMAGKAPEEVATVLLKVSRTDNERIHEDIAAAAVAMPPDRALPLVKAETEWVSKRDYLYLSLPNKLADLVVHLASAKQLEAAISLAKVLFSVRAPAKKDGKPAPLHDVEARFESWSYGESLRQVGVAIAAIAPGKILEMLRDLARDVLSLEDSEIKESDRDLSYIWRPSITSETEYHRDDIKNKVVSAIWDTAVASVAGKLISVADVVSIYAPDGAKSSSLLRRIALAVLSEFPSRENLQAAWPLDPTALDQPDLLPEYASFLKAYAPLLDAGSRSGLLKAIQAGPDQEAIKKSYKAFTEEEISKEDLDSRVARWKRDRYALLVSTLEGEAVKRFDELTKRHGKPRDLAQPKSDIEVGWGSPQPQDVVDFDKTKPQEVPPLLKQNSLSVGTAPDVVEDLGQELARRAGQSPLEYSDLATEFVGLEPVYVRSLLHGLAQGLRQHSQVSWEKTIGLSEWVLEQRDDQVPPQKAHRALLDEDWLWARKAIADILHEAIDDERVLFPPELDARVWILIKKLAEDAQPDPEHEKKYGGDRDWATVAINTVRGQAFHSLVSFALLQKKRLEGGELKAEVRPAAEARVSEALQLLERHLDPKIDPSAAIRSVYGMRFGALCNVDRKWAEAKAPVIFGGEGRLRLAGWNTFVVYQGPAKPLLEILRPQYERAIAELSAPQERAKILPEDPKCRLGFHMMWYYAWGCFDPTPFDGMFSEFFKKAEDRVRAFGIEVMGRTLKSSDDSEIPGDCLTRLQQLWDWRIAESKLNPKEHQQELEAFGWWLVSGKLTDDWTLQRFTDTVRLSHGAEPETDVVDRLAELSTKYPLACVRSLRELLQGESRYRTWGYLHWSKAARSILESALRTTDDEAKALAKESINRLGAMGHAEFRDLGIR